MSKKRGPSNRLRKMSRDERAARYTPKALRKKLRRLARTAGTLTKHDGTPTILEGTREDS